MGRAASLRGSASMSASTRTHAATAQAPAPSIADRASEIARGVDPVLILAALALSCLGLVMVYSASGWLARQTTGSWTYYLQRQSVFLGVGIVVMLAVSRVDYRLLRRYAVHTMLGAIVLLVLVLIFGREVNGAKRWLSIGPISMQPSEVAKIALIIFLSFTLARKGTRVKNFKEGFMPVMFAAGSTMLLVGLEKDLGTTLLLGAIALIMLYVAGTRASYVAGAILMLLPLAWYQVIGVAFRNTRLLEFQAGGGYQVKQGLIAVGSGGIWGAGLGAGRQKLGHLPENHTDFILATVGEELGLLGIFLVLTLFMTITWRGLVIARRAADPFGTYLAVGLSTMFGLQALVNVSVIFNVIPAKGITLPLVSYGGSSLFISLASIGMLLSISRSTGPWRVFAETAASRARKNARARARDHRGVRPNVRIPARTQDAEPSPS
ncbi:MAG: putative lipid II flippase FtsW [Nannocystaceae bacterium]